MSFTEIAECSHVNNSAFARSGTDALGNYTGYLFGPLTWDNEVSYETIKVYDIQARLRQTDYRIEFCSDVVDGWQPVNFLTDNLRNPYMIDQVKGSGDITLIFNVLSGLYSYTRNEDPFFRRKIRYRDLGVMQYTHMNSSS